MSGKFSDQPDKITPAPGDLFPLVDVAAPATLKKITWANLVAAMQGAFAAVSTTVASIVRRATATEVTNGTNVDAFVAPNDLATELAKRVPHSLATATNDVLVGAATPGSWVKKTLAEFKVILGLGSAAYVDTGATSGKVPVLDGSNKIALALLYIGGALGLVQFDAGGKYPAADGSQITNLPVGAPQGYISGLALAYVGTTTYSLGIGAARDAANTEDIVLASLLTKSLNAWAAGSGNGSLDTGAIAANTYYYIWLIKRTDRTAVDVLLSLSGTAPSMPSGYTFKRCIGRLRTNSLAQINPNILISANPAIGGLELWTTAESGGAYIQPPWEPVYNAEVQAGGGSGSWASGPGDSMGASSGGYAKKRIRGQAAGSSITVTVGNGGAVASAGNPGNTSSFGSIMSCTGGSGGKPGDAFNNPPGTSTGGDININGMYGSPGVTTKSGGQGADSVLGLGGPSLKAAVGYGAGGGSSSGESAGGAGAPGVVILTF